jgi:hypothetical protein
LGGIPLTESAERTVATAKAARDRIAQGLGLVSDETGAGQAAQRGARSWMASTERRGGDLYEAIPIAPEHPAELGATRSALGDLTAGLSSNPELSRLIADPKLSKWRQALESGGLSWRDLKAFRSYVGELSGGQTLQSDTPKKALKALYGALSDDMRATASAVGPKALRDFNRANNFWRGREARIEGTLTGILGKDMDKGAAAAFGAIERLASQRGGEPIKLAQTLRSMPADEANTVRATILSRLGQASAGRQGASGDVFSPVEFMTQWNKLSPRAKDILFQGEHRRAIDDIARVYSGMKASTRYANTSKTGIAVGARRNDKRGNRQPVDRRPHHRRPDRRRKAARLAGPRSLALRLRT